MGRFCLHNRLLDAFAACARSGSFTQAAQQLFISPTALIKQINQLEDGLGVKLFLRTPKGLVLTEAGSRQPAAADCCRLDSPLQPRTRRHPLPGKSAQARNQCRHLFGFFRRLHRKALAEHALKISRRAAASDPI